MSMIIQPLPTIDSLHHRVPEFQLSKAASLSGGAYKTWDFHDRGYGNVGAVPIARPSTFQRDSAFHEGVRLPALSTLASIASQYQPMAEVDRPFSNNLSANCYDPTRELNLQRKRDAENPDLFPNYLRASMSYATVAPGQSAGLANGIPPVCGNCQTSTTPLWRRDEDGTVLCNACGLFLKLHGRARPISLKTNIIKSRNRVRTSGPSAQHGQQGQQEQQAHQPKRKKSLPASGSASTSQPDPNHFNAASNNRRLPESHLESSSNIAPQHIFDSITLDAANQQSLAHLYDSGYAPQRNGSPSGMSPMNGAGGAQNGQGESAQTPKDLIAANNHLKTRVSELEVINNLFRERVAELESGEGETKRALDDALKKIEGLKARVAELEGGASDGETDGGVRQSKRLRLSHGTEEGEESAPGTLFNTGTT